MYNFNLQRDQICMVNNSKRQHTDRFSFNIFQKKEITFHTIIHTIKIAFMIAFYLRRGNNFIYINIRLYFMNQLFAYLTFYMSVNIKILIY